MPTTEQVQTPVLPPETGGEDLAAKARRITGITIENFRGLKKLELNGLQAVNLIVGQNNAGKTSLLEAIVVVATRGMLDQLPDLFRANSGNSRRYFKWLLADGAGFGEVVATSNVYKSRALFGHSKLPPRPALSASRVDETQAHGFTWAREFIGGTAKVRVIAVQNQPSEKLVPNFADAVRSPEKQRLMEQLLAKVDLRIRDVRLDYSQGEPFIAVDIGLSERVPLSQLGQGIYRLVAIFAELLGQCPDICLIDEIENGIHHTVLKQVWRGIAEVSAMLGIQVFATTHSKECLEAADEVFFREDTGNKHGFAVIQLLRVKDQVVGKVLNEARVDAALENDIELR